MKTTIDLFAEGRRWIAYCPQSEFHPEKGYRVVFVFENVAGYFPTGDESQGKAPWYWGKTLEMAVKCCDDYNARRGINKDEALTILGSSFAHPESKRAIRNNSYGNSN